MADKLPPEPLDSLAGHDETAKAEELRAALEDPRIANEDADLARALTAAWSPREIAPGRHRVLLERALGRAGGTQGRTPRMRVALGASVVMALAASVCAVLWSERRRPETATETATASRAADVTRAAVAVSRSTQPLFAERFEPIGGETARIDRIALARAVDFRDGEFARWGVR